MPGENYFVEELVLGEPVEARPFLSLADDGPELIKILRALAGAARIRDASDDDVDVIYDVTHNYINPNEPGIAGNLNRILEYIFDELPGDGQLEAISNGIKFKNKPFYSEIREDVCLLLISMELEKYTEAFLYIYRLLERVSVACPLLYVARERDFKSAHAFLAKLSEEKGAGELGMLQRFLVQLAALNQNFDANSLDFTIEGLDTNKSKSLLNQLKFHLSKELQSAVIDGDNGTISVPFKDVSSFVVIIRNRAFHNQSNRSNINIAAIGGADKLFKLIMPGLVYWFSYIFVEIARWQIESVDRGG